MGGHPPLSGAGRVPDTGRWLRAASLALALTLAPGLATPTAAADSVAGNIVVLESDASILQPGKPFDLNGKGLTFTPRAGGGYTVVAGANAFDSRVGTQIIAGAGTDDVSISQALGFSFPFYGTNRTSVFVGSNGFLTFDSSSVLPHFNAGSATPANPLGDPFTVLAAVARLSPRIAVLWEDWNTDPATGGGGAGAVFANALGDRFIATWNAVRLFGSPGTIVIFQAVLFPSGVIQMNYQSVPTTPPGGYLVGISPGNEDEFFITTVNFGQAAGATVSTTPDREGLVQAFGTTATPLVHLPAVARRFVQVAGDGADQLLLFSTLNQGLGGAFAFELMVNPSVAGIGDTSILGINRSSIYGSTGRLQSIVNMNQLSRYPADPNTVFLGSNSTLSVLGQEAGHMWLARVQFRDENGACSGKLLGRDAAHWSFFMDTDASDMEGNDIQDNGNGTFVTVAATQRYNALDQYIMGLRPPSGVAPFFFVDAVTGTTRVAGSGPETGVTFSGTRKNVTADQVVSCEGARSPASGFTAVNPTTTWRQGFVLLTTPGGPTAADLAKIDAIRAAWVPYFNQATGGLGLIDTTLSSSLVAAVLPSSRSVPVGTPATAFATIINTGAAPATGCGLSVNAGLAAAFGYQTTDPATNAVTGTPDTPVDIPAGGMQTFVFALTPTADIASTDVSITFDCANTEPAVPVAGLNTLLLSASTAPIPDIVALAATVGNTGIVDVPGAAGTGVFSVASVNLGASGAITVSADTGSANLTAVVTLCQTDPAGGQCLQPPAASVTTTINAGETPTFGVFVRGTGVVAFAPGSSRIFVRFRDTGQVTRGSTSVAVRTR